MSDEAAREPVADLGTDGAEDRIRSVVKDCVHCGFCLPACPTYSLWGEEMDSPRGRIYLVGQLLDGAPLTPAAGEHFDRCLGCMACMTACPSGVQYDQIIAAAREGTADGLNPCATDAAGVGTQGAVATVAGADGAAGDEAGAAAGGPVAVTPPRALRDRATGETLLAPF